MMLRLALKQSLEMLTPPWNLNLQKLVYHNKTNQIYRVFKLISFGHNNVYVLALLFEKSVLGLFKNMIGFDGNDGAQFSASLYLAEVCEMES